MAKVINMLFSRMLIPNEQQARKLYEMGELRGVELERVLIGWRDDLERGRIDNIPATILPNLGVT
jgi:hypothetical protein